MFHIFCFLTAISKEPQKGIDRYHNEDRPQLLHPRLIQDYPEDIENDEIGCSANQDGRESTSMQRFSIEFFAPVGKRR